MQNQGCGGTLVGDKYVITAAHCTAGQSTSDLKVVVGETNLAVTNDTQRFVMDVLVIKQHPGYDSSTLSNDICVLELSSAVDLTSFPHIKPACLPYSSQITDFVGQSAVVSGWGAIGSGLALNSHLHEVSVEVYGNSNCGTHSTAMSSDMFCAGAMEGGKDSCQGDSGGPLIASDPNNSGALTLIGVVSWGNGCADVNAPGVYSDVPYFMQDGWLMQQLTDLNTCSAPGASPVSSSTSAPATTTTNTAITSTTTLTTSTTTLTTSTTTLTTSTTTLTTSTTTVSCPMQGNSYPRLALIKQIKRTQSPSACKTLCKNNPDCDYWAYLPNNKAARRKCRLFHVTFKSKNKWVSGELTTC